MNPEEYRRHNRAWARLRIAKQSRVVDITPTGDRVRSVTTRVRFGWSETGGVRPVTRVRKRYGAALGGGR